MSEGDKELDTALSDAVRALTEARNTLYSAAWQYDVAAARALRDQPHPDTAGVIVQCINKGEIETFAAMADSMLRRLRVLRKEARR